VEKNYYLHQSARDAYRAYILAYNSHTLKDVYNVHELNLGAVAMSFGFHRPSQTKKKENKLWQSILHARLAPPRTRKGGNMVATPSEGETMERAPSSTMAAAKNQGGTQEGRFQQ
jgi:hypothetical protein